MIFHVIRRALAVPSIGRVIVATDHLKIYEAVRDAGFEVMMTASHHQSGTDRIAEVAAQLEDASHHEIIVNLQGDEPLISPRTIDRAISEIVNNDKVQVVTTCEQIYDARDVMSVDVVKVVIDAQGRAIYFSRAPIPFPRDAVRAHGSIDAALEHDENCRARFRKHTGLYVYRRRFLLEYASWPPSSLERTESLEQLRILERGFHIQVVETDEPSIGVDTLEDYERVKQMIEI